MRKHQQLELGTKSRTLVPQKLDHGASSEFWLLPSPDSGQDVEGDYLLITSQDPGRTSTLISSKRNHLNDAAYLAQIQSHFHLMDGAATLEKLLVRDYHDPAIAELLEAARKKEEQ